MTAQAAAEARSEDVSAEATPPSTEPIDFRVLSGNPTPSELAAVTAVLAATIENLEDVRRQATETKGQSAWQRAQRPIRTPMIHGAGTWRSFSG